MDKYQTYRMIYQEILNKIYGGTVEEEINSNHEHNDLSDEEKEKEANQIKLEELKELEEKRKQEEERKKKSLQKRSKILGSSEQYIEREIKLKNALKKHGISYQDYLNWKAYKVLGKETELSRNKQLMELEEELDIFN